MNRLRLALESGHVSLCQKFSTRLYIQQSAVVFFWLIAGRIVHNTWRMFYSDLRNLPCQQLHVLIFLGGLLPSGDLEIFKGDGGNLFRVGSI